MKLVIFIVLLSLSSNSIFCKTIVRGLNDASTESLHSLLKRKKLFVLFKPNCHACLKQVRDLKCFDQKDIALLGAFSSKKELMREFTKMKRPQYKAYLADPEVIKYFKVTNTSTPQMFVMNKKKWLRILGYKECKKLLKLL